MRIEKLMKEDVITVNELQRDELNVVINRYFGNDGSIGNNTDSEKSYIIKEQKKESKKM